MSVFELKHEEDGGLILRCGCSHPHHQIEFSWIKDVKGQYEPLYIGVTLTKQRFWRRLKFAFNYLFRQPCGYGAYEESIFEKSDCKQLIGFLNKYIEKAS